MEFTESENEESIVRGESITPLSEEEKNALNMIVKQLQNEQFDEAVILENKSNNDFETRKSNQILEKTKKIEKTEEMHEIIFEEKIFSKDNCGKSEKKEASNSIKAIKVSEEDFEEENIVVSEDDYQEGVIVSEEDFV